MVLSGLMRKSLKTMKVLPARKTVICTPVEKQTTKSGLVITPDEKQSQEMGVVYAVGAGTPPIVMKKGDVIVYAKYSDNKVVIESTEFNFIRFEDIKAKVQ